MTADVQERAEHSVPVARDDDRDVADAAREIARPLAELAQVADVLPGPGEDPLALAPRQRGIRVGRPRQRLRHADSLCRDLERTSSRVLHLESQKPLDRGAAARLRAPIQSATRTERRFGAWRPASPAPWPQSSPFSLH